MSSIYTPKHTIDTRDIALNVPEKISEQIKNINISWLSAENQSFLQKVQENIHFLETNNLPIPDALNHIIQNISELSQVVIPQETFKSIFDS